MKDSRRAWAWVGVAIVVIILLIWAVAYIINKWGKPQGTTPTFAPQGQLVAQFPKGLVIDSNASVTGSYALNYSTSTDQYTANYNSSSSISTLYKDYQTYFSANGWTVTGAVTNHPTFEAVTATQGSNQVEVVINQQGKDSQVTVSYLAK